MTHITCRLTAKNRDQVRNPTLGNRVWATFTIFTCPVSRPHHSLVVEHHVGRPHVLHRYPDHVESFELVDVPRQPIIFPLLRQKTRCSTTTKTLRHFTFRSKVSTLLSTKTSYNDDVRRQQDEHRSDVRKSKQIKTVKLAKNVKMTLEHPSMRQPHNGATCLYMVICNHSRSPLLPFHFFPSSLFPSFFAFFNDDIENGIHHYKNITKSCRRVDDTIECRSKL